MNLILDLLIVAVVVLCAWIGKTRGFIRTIFGFLGSLISFFAASILARPVGNFLAEKFFSPAITRYFSALLSEQAQTEASKIDFSNLPEACNEVLVRFGITSEQIGNLVEQGATSGAQALEKVAEFVVTPVAMSVGFAVAFVVLFVFFAVLIRILVKALDLISRLPILNFSNRILGLAAGALWGLFLAVLLSALLRISEPGLQGSGVPFLQNIDLEKTYLIRFLSKIDFFGIA